MHTTLTLCITASWSRDGAVFCVLGHFAMSSLLHCPDPTAAHYPFLGDRGPLPPKWRPFPQDPRTLPSHGSEQLQLFFSLLLLITGQAGSPWPLMLVTLTGIRISERLKKWWINGIFWYIILHTSVLPCISYLQLIIAHRVFYSWTTPITIKNVKNCPGWPV